MLKKTRWYVLSVVIILIDQLTKYWAVNSLAFAQPHPIFPFFNLTLAHNTGAAFGFLSSWGSVAAWLFSAIAILVSLVIAVVIYKLPPTKKWLAFGLALILGGAISNLIDRLLYGHVIDFFDFYLRNWHFATFNVADAAISVGAIIWIGITLLFDTCSSKRAPLKH